MVPRVTTKGEKGGAMTSLPEATRVLKKKKVASRMSTPMSNETDTETVGWLGEIADHVLCCSRSRPNRRS